ncbi:hypothetical protein QTP86_007245 [Hemibagrus guttatus]|nr:hypothetical protein QTP86_007245 [Hemibagrus guttatus]
MRMRPGMNLVRSAVWKCRLRVSHGAFQTNQTIPKRTMCTETRNKWIRPAGYDTGIKTFNSLTKQKEPLVLAQEGRATWYSCGPTVYDHAHLGHACSYVRFDILQRILSRIFGINVTHVMVITDIDDKIIQRSIEERISPLVLARMYEEDFKKDMLALKVLPPAVYMRVTEQMPQIVAFIEGIIRNGHAYTTSQGDVYFDTRSIGSRYGKLANMGNTAGESGISDKRDPRDFALWKAWKPLEPFWESPWGRGRPGWHIECSTIASSVFGSQLDIHSGGIDLAFPHHENEIAQCEAYHKCEQWGNYFLHSAIDYSDASMNEALSTLSSISDFVHNAQAYMQGHLQCQDIHESFLWERLSVTQATVRAVLADDFDTPKAMDAIMNLIHHGNCQLQPVTKVDGTSRCPAVFGAMLSYIRDIMDALGVDLLDEKNSRHLSPPIPTCLHSLLYLFPTLSITLDC